MRVVFLKIRNFRGIKALDWSPSATVNCLIGPGDSCKTTILDAIELALGQRTHVAIEDSDFYDLDVDRPIEIVATMAGLSLELKSDTRYGLQLRGWDQAKQEVVDEPDESLEDALSIRVHIDKDLEPHWSIFNSRVEELSEEDRPSLRYKDAQNMSATRLGPYAEKHLSWSRNSVLTRLSESPDKVSGHLAAASRAAKESFRKDNPNIFKTIVARVQDLARQFMVKPRSTYAAELDIRGVNISAGGISLHDGLLPLRRLGTGSARLIVSALQSETSGSKIALVDELEHGLEPHRIARLLKYLKTSPEAKHSQLFITSHSPVVIRELQATDIFATLAKDGIVYVNNLCSGHDEAEFIQKQIRREPEAFLAKSVLVGEGRTEAGFLRELDAYWSGIGKDSFAFCGIVVADGGGSTALGFSKQLAKLGYRVLVLLDSDKPATREKVQDLEATGTVVVEWPDSCATEHRVFADLPWEGVRKLVNVAVRLTRSELGVKNAINKERNKCQIPEINDLSLPSDLDVPEFRRALGCVALQEEWFKTVERGEELGRVVKDYLSHIARKPLGRSLDKIRNWADS